ncbi:MAG: hypothetical protein IPJ39_22175 [Saprospiraceae bacterium]|nr:hypothetical protein [Saprospiraceae bacterium]
MAGGLKKNDCVFSTLGSGQISRDIIKWAYEDDTKCRVMYLQRFILMLTETFVLAQTNK